MRFANTRYSDFNTQKESLEKKSETAQYYYRVTEFQKLLFLFLSSLRQAKFDFIVRNFKSMLSWIAARGVRKV